jgi:hypothetical protein
MREHSAVGYHSRFPLAERACVVGSCHRSADTAEALPNGNNMHACGRTAWCRAKGWMPYGPC